jgi:hypothetical protein
MSLGGHKYCLTLQNLHTDKEKEYFMKQKSESFTNYKKYEAWVKVQWGANIGVFGCDWGGEFTSKEFTKHLDNSGTIHHLTVHDSPQSNGAIKRANRTHTECARAMMIAAGLPLSLWAKACRHSVWIHNRVPTCVLPDFKTPHEMATGEKPNLVGMHQWGCKVWVRKLDAGKLDARAEEGCFVGIDSESKGYRIYWPGKNRVSIEKDVYFNEDEELKSSLRGRMTYLTIRMFPSLPAPLHKLPNMKTMHMHPAKVLNPKMSKTQPKICPLLTLELRRQPRAPRSRRPLRVLQFFHHTKEPRGEILWRV